MTDALQIYSSPDIYRINVPLPGSPLKNLNSYVIKTPARNLIIDTGFNMPEARDALINGLTELDVDMSRTDIYATHMHSDHIGLISELARDDTLVYMDATDYGLVTRASTDGWGMLDLYMQAEGFPQAELAANHASNPGRRFKPDKAFAAHTVRDGDRIRLGECELTVISVPGHTPGNTCLYLARERILFSGDHILFDITPNITSWPIMSDALGSYLTGLNKVRALDIKLTLPGHRMYGTDVYARIDELLEHHENRLQNTLDVLLAHPGISSYEAAGYMEWSMNGLSWAEAPVHQKWFATGETCAHLMRLVALGRARRQMIDGRVYYCGAN